MCHCRSLPFSTDSVPIRYLDALITTAQDTGMNLRRIFILLTSVMVSVPVVLPAAAQNLVDPRGGRQVREPARRALTLDQAAARVRKQTGAQILSAQERISNGERYYRFKINEKGRVRVIYLQPDGTRFKPGR